MISILPAPFLSLNLLDSPAQGDHIITRLANNCTSLISTLLTDTVPPAISFNECSGEVLNRGVQRAPNTDAENEKHLAEVY